jgi:hypothetical protein
VGFGPGRRRRTALRYLVGYVSQHGSHRSNEMFVECICKSIWTRSRVVFFGLNCFRNFQWGDWGFEVAYGVVREFGNVIRDGGSVEWGRGGPELGEVIGCICRDLSYVR